MLVGMQESEADGVGKQTSVSDVCVDDGAVLGREVNRMAEPDDASEVLGDESGKDSSVEEVSAACSEGSGGASVDVRGTSASASGRSSSSRCSSGGGGEGGTVIIL